jgi:hypothetical protein
VPLLPLLDPPSQPSSWAFSLYHLPSLCRKEISDTCVDGWGVAAFEPIAIPPS